MSGFQLTASLASSLAWPVLVAILLAFVWIKRDDLSKLFNLRAPSQGRALRRFRAGPVEFEWDQLIESTAGQVSEVPPVTASAPDSPVSILEQLSPIARNVPTAAVLEAFARLEQRLREVFDRVRDDYEDGKYRPQFLSIAQIARTLSENGQISEEIYSAILNLNRLKNEASHRVGSADINVSQASDYLVLVDRVLNYLKIFPGSYGAALRLRSLGIARLPDPIAQVDPRLRQSDLFQLEGQIQ